MFVELIKLISDISQRTNQSFYGFVVNQLPSLSEKERIKSKTIADEIYTKALKYLNDWYNFANTYFISVQKFNLKNGIPSIDDWCKIAKYLNNVDLKEDQIFHELLIN